MKGSMLAAFAMSLGLFAGVAGTQTASAMVLPAVGASAKAISQAPVTAVQFRGRGSGWRPGYRWRPGYGWVAPAVVGAVIAGAVVGAAVAGPGPYYAPPPPPPPPPAPYPYYGPAPYYGPRY